MIKIGEKNVIEIFFGDKKIPEFSINNSIFPVVAEEIILTEESTNISGFKGVTNINYKINATTENKKELIFEVIDPLPPELTLDSKTGELKGICMSVFSGPIRIKISGQDLNPKIFTFNFAISEKPEISIPNETIEINNLTQKIRMKPVLIGASVSDGSKINYKVDRSTPLPNGLVLNEDTGEISGIPLESVAKTAKIIISSQNANEKIITVSFNIAPDNVNYFTLTSNEPSSEIYLSKNSTPNTIELYYSLNNDEWTLWNSPDNTSNKIVLQNKDDNVRFKGNNYSFNKIDNYYKFMISKKTSASGSIMTLLDPEDKLRNLSGKDGCFSHLFDECINLTSAPELPATDLSTRCYEQMFKGCTNLIKMPVLNSDHLGIRSYDKMFQNCKNLMTVYKLPAKSLTNFCYWHMFEGCEKLVDAPEICAENLTERCFEYMFRNCVSLKNAPVLSAITLANNCYAHMFSNCSSLEIAPELPANALANNCYNGMFSGCKAIKSGPELPAKTLVTGCYNSMFSDCSLLSNVSVKFENWVDNTTVNWLSNVAQTGTFKCSDKLDTSKRDASHVPSGWTFDIIKEKKYRITSDDTGFVPITEYIQVDPLEAPEPDAKECYRSLEKHTYTLDYECTEYIYMYITADNSVIICGKSMMNDQYTYIIFENKTEIPIGANTGKWWWFGYGPGECNITIEKVQ